MQEQFNTTNQNQTEQSQKSLTNKIMIPLIVVIVLCIGGILYLSFSKQLQQLEEGEIIKKIDFDVKKVMSYDWDNLITDEKILNIANKEMLMNYVYDEIELIREDSSEDFIAFKKGDRSSFSIMEKEIFYEKPNEILMLGIDVTLKHNKNDSLDLLESFKSSTQYLIDEGKYELIGEMRKIRDIGDDNIFLTTISHFTEERFEDHKFVFVRGPFIIYLKNLDFISMGENTHSFFEPDVLNIGRYIDRELEKILDYK